MSSHGSPSSDRAFQLRLNPLTGDSEWIVVVDGDREGREEAEEAQGTPRSLLATTSYLDMLNDSRRNRAFRRAIEKTVTKPCHVLDIGAGTGLLSMMAARAMEEVGGGEKGKVSACESYLPMVKLMRRVLRANGMERKVKVFHRRSDELRVGPDLESRADVLVSEILDSELLGEGLIPTLQHAHDMLLVKNPQTIPYRATIYSQLVESIFLWKMHDLDDRVNASDGIRLTPEGLGRALYVKSEQHAMNCSAITTEIRPLSEPFKVFEFDFWRRPNSHGETEKLIKVTDDGNIHAVVSWWVLQLDSEGSVFYSTSPRWIQSSNLCNNDTNIPGDGYWCDHWRQCVWFTPGNGIPVSRDGKVHFGAFHNEISISYCLRNDNQTCYIGFNSEHLMLPPERIALYGDNDRRLAFSKSIRNALHGRASPFCFVADDSVYLTILLASLSSASNITSVFPGLQDNGLRYLHAIADANGLSMNHIKVIGKRISCLTTDDLNQGKIDLLVAEPLYCGYEGMLPWQNLRFWKERTMLDPILSNNVFIMPYKGILKACAMSLPDLWRSRCSLKDIEGFDHSVVNDILGACGDIPPLQESPCLACFIWQSGEVKELSEVFSVMEFDFLKPIHACSGKTRIGFLKSGLCHGYALWIDWVLDETNSIIVSTGPDCWYWRQGVKLLSKPVEVNAGEGSSEIEALFDPLTGELTVVSSFSSF